MLDLPNSRSSHHVPTPRGGGVVFVCIASVGSILLLLFGPRSGLISLPIVVAPLLSLPLSLVGFFDDRYDLPVSLRFSIQFFTAFIAVVFSPLVSFSYATIPVVIFFLFTATALINFTNFMDGLDGLVAGCMVCILFAAAVQFSSPASIWILVGSLIGFLCWNWSPAKVFMGDVGSTFLGSVFSILLFQSPSWLDFISLLLVASPILADALICVLRRFFSGQSILQPHRLHLYQRLHQAGWSHARVSLLYILTTFFLGLTLIFGGFVFVLSSSLFILILGFWLDVKVAVPFLAGSRK